MPSKPGISLWRLLQRSWRPCRISQYTGYCDGFGFKNGRSKTRVEYPRYRNWFGLPCLKKSPGETKHCWLVWFRIWNSCLFMVCFGDHILPTFVELFITWFVFFLTSSYNWNDTSGSFSTTAIASRKHRFSSDHRSETGSRQVSTWMGDLLGIPGVVVFFTIYKETNNCSLWYSTKKKETFQYCRAGVTNVTKRRKKKNNNCKE